MPFELTYRLLAPLELIRVSKRDEIRRMRNGWWPCRTPPSVNPCWAHSIGLCGLLPCSRAGPFHLFLANRSEDFIACVALEKSVSAPRHDVVSCGFRRFPAFGRDARKACRRAEVPRLPQFDLLATVSCAQGHRNNCADSGI